METALRQLLRADLHVHSRHSLLGSLPVLGARDCYSDPREVYLRAKARGMDLVTLTDHDTIDGCLEFLSSEGERPDFFISEEVSTQDPVTGCSLHVSVYGIEEKDHREIQYLRANIRELLVHLEREEIPAALNHLGSSLVRRRPAVGALLDLLSQFPLLESLNGAQRGSSNRLAEEVADLLSGRGRRPGRTGGSDAHTPARIGSAWTEAEAHDRESFLEALREGKVRPGGAPSRLVPMIRDVYRIVLDYYFDVAWNRRRHLTPEGRRMAAACALASLPLHLVALPLSGMVFRYLWVHRAVRRARQEIALAQGSRPEVSAAIPWVANPGSEEV